MTLVRRLLLLLAVLFCGALLAAAPASAHATVVGADPADGTRLQSAPSTVTVSFDESVGLGSIGYLHVTDQTGKRVDAGAAYHPGGDGTKIADKLTPGLADGTYTESYRVVSADSHPVAGVIRFVVGKGALTAATVSSSTVNHGLSVVFDVVRWLSWAGLALLGGAWLLLTVWPQGRDDRGARGIVWSGWGAAVLGAVLELLVQGPYAAGNGPSVLLRPALLDATLHTDYGQFHCARLLLLGALGVLLGLALQPGRERARHEDAVWPLAVGIAFTFSATGHAETTRPSWLSLALDTAHLTAMATWVGGLVIVVAALLPRRDPDELAVTLPTFSRVAFTAVVVLAVTGAYAALRGVGSWRALFGTEYGLLVLAKVVLFGGLLAVGNLSRQLVQRRALVAYAMTDDVLDDDPVDLTESGAHERTDDVDTERLRRSVLVEIALAGIVLAATAVLVGQPRGAEALSAQAREPIHATAPLGSERTASVTVDPGEHGNVSVEVALSPGPRAQSVTATATQPDRQIGPIPVQLIADGADLYTASDVNLPVSGKWVIALVVTTSKFRAVATQVTVHLS